MTADDLLRVLSLKTGFDPIEHALLSKHGEGHMQYRLLGRVSGPHVGTWRLFLLHILRASRRAPWSIDISRNYMLKEMPTGETTVAYAWRLVLQDRKKENHIEHHFPAIRQSLVDYQPVVQAAAETEEVKLYGTRRNTNASTGGGYASSLNNAVVGPAAAAARRAGG